MVKDLMLDGAVPGRDLALVPLLEAVGEPGKVAVAPAGVCDDVISVVGVLGDDGVVDDAAGGVEEDGEGGGVVGEGVEGGRGEPEDQVSARDARAENRRRAKEG